MLVDSKTWEVEEDTRYNPHYTTCKELFPDFDPWAEFEKRKHLLKSSRDEDGYPA
jgi:hypothetical protein